MCAHLLLAWASHPPRGPAGLLQLQAEQPAVGAELPVRQNRHNFS
jgi:hypothetical protein